MVDGPEQDIRSESLVGDPLVVVPVVFDPPVVAPLVSDPTATEVTTVNAVATPAETHLTEIVEGPIVEPATMVPTVVPMVTTSGTVRTSYARSFAPDAIAAAVVGLFILLIGLLAITRGGFDGPIETPVVRVLGFTHTTLLGLIETVIGLCLLTSGATRSRSASLFFGSVLGIGAFVGAVQTDSFRKNLALESSFAWVMVLSAVVVVLAALLLPRYVQRSMTVHPV
jgi:hypothetical protein